VQLFGIFEQLLRMANKSNKTPEEQYGEVELEQDPTISKMEVVQNEAATASNTWSISAISMLSLLQMSRK